MENNFDTIVDRRFTNSIKWDGYTKVFGKEDILPMWVADSDWPAPGPVIEALKKRVDHGVYGYTEPGDDLNRVVVDWVKRRYKWEIKAEWLVYISGVVPAINSALKTFTGPGGNVIIQPPVYRPFFAAVKNNGANLIENQLTFIDRKYRMDLTGLEEELKYISKNQERVGNVQIDKVVPGNRISSKEEEAANMIILCNPHNPVGRVWSRDELKELAELCMEHNLIIVSDEIHGDLIYSDQKHLPIASISEDIAENTITMIAPSKTFNLAGLGAAVTIIPDKKMRNSFQKTMQGFVTSGNLMGYTAMKAAYSCGDKWLDRQLEYLEKNRDFAVKYINSNIPGIEVVKPEGTYLLWLDCRDLGFNNQGLEKFMVEKAGVGLNSGDWFGSGGEGFMRMNMACPRTTLEEGLKRIKNAVIRSEKNGFY